MTGSRRIAGKKEMHGLQSVRAVWRVISKTAPGSWRTFDQAAAAGSRASASSEAAHGDSQGKWVAPSPSAGTLTAIAPSIQKEGSGARGQGSEKNAPLPLTPDPLPLTPFCLR